MARPLPNIFSCTAKYLATALFLLLVQFIISQPVHAALPSGFVDTHLATLAAPTALAFTSDGRLLITTQPGLLRIYQNGTLLPAPALDLLASDRICNDFERGLLGVAVDPAFAVNRYIYLYYTFKKSATCIRNAAASPVNRVSRFILGDSNSISPASETVLIDNIPSPNGNHNAGDLAFGQDGLLYISVGDGGCDYLGISNSGCGGANNAALDKHILLGKILRITASGAIPAANPFQGSDSARCNITGRTDPGKQCQETFSSGLRNPFRIAFDRNVASLKFFINDVGQNLWEEIDHGRPGVDYGWNLREGPCPNGQSTNCGVPPAGLTNPIFFYKHDSSGCNSITGGAFVPRGIWPALHEGSYLYSDVVCSKIFEMVIVGGRFVARDFATGLGPGGPIHLLFGPFDSGQALYYTTYASGGQLHRISYSGAANRAPTTVATVTPRFGALPLSVTFDASASFDPDGDTLTYLWQFGDGTPDQSGVSVLHTYASEGRFFPLLRVEDSRGGVGNRTLRVDPGHTAPQPTIISPTSATRFAVGQTLTLRGSAIDELGAPVPDSALLWQVQLRHGSHMHPYLPLTPGNNIPLVAPAAEDLAALNNSYLIVTLFATDARGLTQGVAQFPLPKKVNVGFSTVPAGLKLLVNGTEFTTPFSLSSWDAYAINVSAPNQSSGSATLNFTAWSDGGAQSHTIITPATPRNFTATFQ